MQKVRDGFWFASLKKYLRTSWFKRNSKFGSGNTFRGFCIKAMCNWASQRQKKTIDVLQDTGRSPFLWLIWLEFYNIKNQSFPEFALPNPHYKASWSRRLLHSPPLVLFQSIQNCPLDLWDLTFQFVLILYSGETLRIERGWCLSLSWSK